VPGVAAFALTPAQREAFASGIAAGLHLEPEDVRVTRVLATSGPAAMTTVLGLPPSNAVASVMQQHSKATTIEFTISPARPEASVALDRAEARLILLSRGGLAAERFDQSLVQRITAAGVALPTTDVRTLVAVPQQVGLRAAGAARAAALAGNDAAAAAGATAPDSGRRLQGEVQAPHAVGKELFVV